MHILTICAMGPDDPQLLTRAAYAALTGGSRPLVAVLPLVENVVSATAVKMGDVITKVDSTAIASMEDLTVAKKQYSAGDTCTLTIYREGQETAVELTWGAVPEDQQSNVADQGQQPQNGGQYGNGYTNPNDLFNFFFGNRFGGNSYRYNG